MMYKILMKPDYGEALFWNEEGCCIGGYDVIYIGEDGNETAIYLSSIIGLKEWFHEWDSNTLYLTHWTDSQWRIWWKRGMEFAKVVNQLLPNNVVLEYFSLNDPIWKVKPEDTDDGGLFNNGGPITLLKAGIYNFECYIMPWTAYELGSDSKYNHDNPIIVSLHLSYDDIQDLVDMIKWAHENYLMEKSTSETVCSKLLQTRLPHLYDKIHLIAHEMFCADYPNRENIAGFGVYEIFCPDEIYDFATLS